MDDERLKIEAIASFGRKYQEVYLYTGKDKNELKQSLTSDWWEALKFFFGRSFMRGRRDEISNKFMERAIHILEQFFGDEKTKFLQGLNNNKEWKEDLTSKLQEGKVNNKGDRKMVVSTLGWISGLNDDGFNLINYSLRKAKEKRIEELYGELDRLNYVGDKLASFFLRDVACIFDLQVNNEQQIFLQPVDTWVDQVVESLGIYKPETAKKAISGNKEALNTVRKQIVKSCNGAGVSPIEFNQGAWYIGPHSFQILLENLGRIR